MKLHIFDKNINFELDPNAVSKIMHIEDDICRTENKFSSQMHLYLNKWAKRRSG